MKVWSIESTDEWEYRTPTTTLAVCSTLTIAMREAMSFVYPEDLREVEWVVDGDSAHLKGGDRSNALSVSPMNVIDA